MIRLRGESGAALCTAGTCLFATAAVPLFHIEYAVDSAARVVFVIMVQLMPNSPLTGP